MEQHDPNRPIQVPFWQWNLFVDYIDEVEGLFLAVEDLHNRDVLQRDLLGIFLRVLTVIDHLDHGGPELDRPLQGQLEGPVDNPGPGATATRNDSTPTETGEAAYRAYATYATKRYWCIYLSTGNVTYYGTYAGAVAKCHKLAAPANVSCLGVKKGRCP